MKKKRHNPGGERTKKDHRGRDIPAKRIAWRAEHGLSLQ